MPANEPFIVAGEAVVTDAGFRAVDPALGAEIEPRFSIAGATHVAAACAAAAAAFPLLTAAPRERRALLLEAIAERIEAAGDALIARAMAETGLPRPRLEGERARTTAQLRMFAELVRDGAWQDIRVDPALHGRTPLPRPDLRLVKRAVGPVAVFGASNFPLAFSVAGGDTAAALAAGCPVVAKGHPAHPGLSALVGTAISEAVRDVGLPGGVFSLLAGPGNALGAALVQDPRIAAVGFTGSRAGGLALIALAAGRSAPIPAYAEMSSVNPVILLPGALSARTESLATGFVQSLTFSVGQLCTNPGLVFAVDGPDLAAFIDTAAALVSSSEAGTMLSQGIAQAYRAGIERLAAVGTVAQVARGDAGGMSCRSGAALFSVDAVDFAREPSVREEIFGHAAVIVRCGDAAELADALTALDGQLTATLHLDPSDEPLAGELMPILEGRAGRILANGWPTGVEVSPAMVHGGPFPATSDGRSTSVGTLAIDRFLRPICYQNMPRSLLPAALRDDGMGAFARRVDGRLLLPD